MQNTNVNRPAGQTAAKAQTITATSGPISTSDWFISAQRTVSVRVIQGEIRLRYAPMNPKPAPEQTR